MVFQFRKNLVIAVPKGYADPADFIDIGNRIAARAPDVRVYVVDDEAPAQDAPAAIWNDPTLTVGFRKQVKFRPRRGTLLINSPVEKLQQAEMFARSGIATPHAEKFYFGMEMPQSVWGSHVLMKPANYAFTSHNEAVQLYRRERLASMTVLDIPPDHFMRKAPMLAQKFIDTGDYPTKYRVLTLMGEILYCQHTRLLARRPALDAPDEVLENAVVGTGGGDREYTPSDESDVLAFAKKVASAFGGKPLLGMDIIRDIETRQLYALEVNAGGNVWHFSSPMWAERRHNLPHVGRDMMQQFGAFEVAAKALIAATRRLAS